MARFEKTDQSLSASTLPLTISSINNKLCTRFVKCLRARFNGSIKMKTKCTRSNKTIREDVSKYKTLGEVFFLFSILNARNVLTPKSIFLSR